MCGLFGFCGSKKPNIPKIKMLGMYNLSRGRDSCGIFIDNNIIKGTGLLKEWTDFIENTIIPVPKENNVVIAHTRSSTRGANTDDNAHPFLINDRFVGAHNGTIHNIDDLCLKYGLKANDYPVDSQALLTLIEQEGFQVLNEYKGYAALAFTWPDDPNTLYLYHGRAKTYKTATDATEERPLYYMETKEGIYFSSLKDSLESLRQSDTENPVELPHNVVFQIKSGKFTDVRFDVDRGDCNINVYSSNSNCSVGNASRASNNHTPKKTWSTGGSSAAGTSNGAASSSPSFHEPLVQRETLPGRVKNAKEGDNFIYFHRGRYYAFPRTLCNGQILVLDKGYITEDSANTQAEVLYFWEGIFLDSKNAYMDLLEKKADKNSFLHTQDGNWAGNMSRYSRYPITNLTSQSQSMQPYYRHAWFLNEKRYDGSITPRYGNGRTYEIDKGLLKRIHGMNVNEETIFNTYSAADMELRAFLLGDLGGSIGGDSCDIAPPFRPDINRKNTPYPSGGTMLTNAKEGAWSSDHNAGKSYPARTEPETEGDLLWWYEVIPANFDELSEAMGPLETKALKKYVKTWLEQISPLEVEDKEVEMAVCDIIVTASTSYRSILEILDSDSERELLKKTYQDMLDDWNEAHRESQQHTEIIDEEPDEDPVNDYAISMLNEAVNEENNEPPLDMKVYNIAEDVLDIIENMQGCADELQANQDSDLAQQLAYYLYISLDGLCANLTKVSEEHKLSPLVERLKQLKKNKEKLTV